MQTGERPHAYCDTCDWHETYQRVWAPLEVTADNDLGTGLHARVNPKRRQGTLAIGYRQRVIDAAAKRRKALGRSLTFTRAAKDITPTVREAVRLLEKREHPETPAVFIEAAGALLCLLEDLYPPLSPPTPDKTRKTRQP